MSMQANRFLSVLSIVVGLGISAGSKAALYDRGGGLIYDGVLNVTWLQDAKFAKSPAYGSSGLFQWQEANSWASGLVYHDSIRNVDYDDWRLPKIVNPCFGFCSVGGPANQSSELASLFYQLGGLPGFSISSTHNSNYDIFLNFGGFYWLDKEYSGDRSTAWYFNFHFGNQYYLSKDDRAGLMLVRDGDVATVTLPATAWLFGSALIGLTGLKRNKHRKD